MDILNLDFGESLCASRQQHQTTKMNQSKNFKGRIQLLLLLLVLLGLLATAILGAVGLAASDKLKASIDALGKNSQLLTEGNLGLSNTIASYLDRQESITSATEVKALIEIPDKAPLEAAFNDQFSTLRTNLTGWRSTESEAFLAAYTEFNEGDNSLIEKKQRVITKQQQLDDTAFEIQSVSARIRTNADTLTNLVADYQQQGDKEKGKGLFWGLSSKRQAAKEVSELLLDKNSNVGDTKSVIGLYLSGLEKAAQRVVLASNAEDLNYIKHDLITPLKNDISTMITEISETKVEIDNYEASTNKLRQDFDLLSGLLDGETNSLETIKIELLQAETNLSQLQQELEASRTALLDHLDKLSRSGDALAARTKISADQVAKRTRDLIITIGALVFLCLLLFGNAIARRIRTMAAQIESHAEEMAAANEQINQAHGELQEANQLITDSINYASRIQQSILSSEENLNASTEEHFALWQPKDIVGGDIYWCRHWGNGYLMLLVDCTGHGVPGAFMTILTKAALDNALTKVIPGHLSDLIGHIHQKIQSELKNDLQNTKQDSYTNDGLDLAACYIDPNADELTFAGARLSLIYRTTDGNIEEVKGDKLSLGYQDLPANIHCKEHKISLQKLSACYLISDGFIDQVGGEKSISFGKKRLFATLTDLTGVSLADQQQKLNQTLLDYQGKAERRDDVTVIGFVPKGIVKAATENIPNAQLASSNAE